MKAEIIAVGTELLLGDILNTNAQYLAKRLADMGINVYHQSVVGDNPLRVKEEFSLAFSRSDIVIATGGLGPTKDDLTKEIGGKFFNKKMVLHKESLKEIQDYFKEQNKPLTENNKKQAYFPEGSIILPNDFGTAPGCIIKNHSKILILLPGPPRENIPMFEKYAASYLEKLTNYVLVSKVLRICGLGESTVVTKISDIIDNQCNPTVAPYAKQNEVTLRLTAKAKTRQEGLNLIKPVELKIKNILKDSIYGENNITLEDTVAKKLIEKNLTISIAESCTGGLLCGKLINYPGISKVLLEGAVTYSNEAKIKRLNVKKETLKNFGAVSKETAMEMAEGIAKSSHTHIGLSTTGIAGPSGGTKEKPVGLVYIGLYIKGTLSYIKLNLAGNRQNIRYSSVIAALDFLRRNL
ncbi:competence/damage-inducible protein A [Clostridium rectalis]|uniref:competence/damage-inducible protein A n=1 Tax=Clostridium rectalis TaxID=2040295 RepID=UPI000F62EB39|nr:competence/damage-inducible protein A [Clostridium rectalis]